jgi:hypothetical protein
MEKATRLKRKPKTKPFRFTDLPPEIRLRVYELALCTPRSIDLTAWNSQNVAPLLRVFLVSRQIYDESYRVFYSVNTFRIFSCDGKFFNAKHQLLSRLTPSYRTCITSIELRLGPGWTKPPKHWVLTKKMGLAQCTALKQLKIFAELDPENSRICQEWLSNHCSYTNFSTELVIGILTAVPSITEVWFDGFPSVQKDGPLVTALLTESKKAGKRITFGPLRGWDKVKDESTVDAIVKDTAALMLAGAPSY